MVRVLTVRTFDGMSRPRLRRTITLLRICLVASAASLVSLPAQQPPEARSARSGRVVDSRSGEGLASARVTLLMAGSDEIVSETGTDREGSFAFAGVEAGRYRAKAAKRGYVNLLPGNASAHTITIPGAEEQSVTITLTPTGVITGRVTDPSGQPVRNAKATALVRRAGAEGVQLLPQGSPVPVDDRGEYRLYDLPPGRYTVVVASSGSTSGASFAPVYFPGTYDAARAEFFPVEGATERRGTDLLVSDTGLYSLRGVVTGLPAAGEIGNTAVTLVPASGVGLPFGTVDTDSEARFQFSGVPPGSYYAIALSPVIGRSAFGPIPGSQAMQGIARVEIGLQDVSEVSIALRPGIAISGQAGFGRPDRANRTCLHSATVVLRSVNPAVPGPPLTARITPSGQFKFQGVFEGNYRISLQTEDGECFLERITVGGRPVERATITLDGAHEQVQLALLLAGEGGSVKGTVADAGGAPAGGALVLMMPGDLTSRVYSEELQATTVDSGGRFAFRHLPPGQYVLLAVRSIRSNEFLDPLFWSEQQLDTLGVVVNSGGEIEAALRINQ